jgi:hypothetical protein
MHCSKRRTDHIGIPMGPEVSIEDRLAGFIDDYPGCVTSNFGVLFHSQKRVGWGYN